MTIKQTYTLATVLAEYAKQIDKAGSLTMWAKREDVALGYATDVRNGNRPIGPKILRALGFAPAETLYVKVR